MKSRMFYAMFAVFLCGMTLSACGKKELLEESSSDRVQSESSAVVSEKPAKAPVTAPKEAETSPLSGLTLTEAEAKQPIVGVMFDNHWDARWQSGLSQAEICYEYPMEGDLTRYLGLFLKNAPEVGPVRSARPYFLDRIMEWDALYAHFGGSGQALAEVQEFEIPSMNGLHYDGSLYQRSSDREAPHNAYTSVQTVREFFANSKHSAKDLPRPLHFGELNMPANSADVPRLRVQDAPGGGGNSEYQYDPASGTYARFKDGKRHVDGANQEPLQVANILVLLCPWDVIDNEGHLGVSQVGRGEGYFFRNGKMQQIQWEKEDRESVTRFTDAKGKDIVLKPGQTWIQIVGTDEQMSFPTE